jgi:hypothetical protein
MATRIITKDEYGRKYDMTAEEIMKKNIPNVIH